MKNSSKMMGKQQKNRNPVNPITNKKKVENQNQEHNVREEGIHPINKKD